MRLRPSLLVLVALIGLVAALASATAFSPVSGAAADGPGGTAAAPPAAPGAGAETPATVASPAPTPTPSPDVDVPAPGRAEIRDRLDGLLASPAVGDAVVGVAVRDRDGRTVFDHRANDLLLPASTMKLVTAAAALATFGPDHRFQTAAALTGPAAADGTVAGDLVVVGSGDPVLGTPRYEQWIYPARPRTGLEHLADGIVASGVRRITGSVVGDGTAFSGASAAAGWPERYFADLDARHISGLTVNGGLTYAIDEAATPPRVDVELADDPARLAARELTALLEARGVEVAGDPRSADAAVPVTDVIATVESPPLDRILRHMVQRSDNQVADTLVRGVAVARTGSGTWAMAGLAARAAVASLGVDTRGLVLRDGSGLSRANRLSAAFLADLDAAMAAGPQGEEWRSLMAVAGREGTLRHRLAGTLAEGRFLGKTGTLADVKAVAGSVQGPDGARYHVAVIANGARGAERAVAAVLTDEIVLALTEDLHGCTRLPVPSPSDAASPQPAPSPPAPAASPGPSPAPNALDVEPYTLVCAAA